MSEKIKVEIFRDVSASSSIDTAIAHEGLAKISDGMQVKPFEVIGDSRKIRITSTESSPVKFDSIHWPSLRADYSIILTDKPITVETPRGEIGEVCGVAKRFADRNLVNGVAVVRADITEPVLTAAHEVGHLLGIQYLKGDDLDTHCRSVYCVMHEFVIHEETTERVVKKGLHGLLERRGFRPAEYTNVERNLGQKFCTPCQEQLARRAFFTLKYLSGESIDPSWV